MMGSVSDGRVQIEDNEGTQLSPKCLGIPLILGKIFQHCSNSELLQLSLVSKQWNYEARSVIKARGEMSAHLNPREPCKDLALLASHLLEMNVVPYSGICFDFELNEKDEHRMNSCKPCSSKASDSDFEVILNRLQLKHLAVSFTEHLALNRECPALLLVKKVLQGQCGVLESLTVGFTCKFEDFILQAIEHSTFLRLKTLKVRRSPRHFFGAARMFVKTIVSRAPNLQELHLDSPLVGYKDLLQGSSAVIVVDSEIDPVNGRIRSDLIFALRLTRMRLEFEADWNFSMEKFNRIVPVVLQSSRTTLQALTLNSAFAPSLMRYGIRLENVTKLAIDINDQCEYDDPECAAADASANFRILQDFDFNYIFPKLNEVEIISSTSASEVYYFVDLENLNAQQPSPDRAVNIKHLKYKRLDDFGERINVSFLASVFPHIETLSIENWDGCAPFFGLIWDHLAHLKHLVVHARDVFRRNWDSLFCGLHHEEISELREKDDEYLKAVNIVPIMPAITGMKELRTFTLSSTCGFVYGENYPTFMLSKVTALIAFQDVPTSL